MKIFGVVLITVGALFAVAASGVLALIGMAGTPLTIPNVGLIYFVIFWNLLVLATGLVFYLVARRRSGSRTRVA
ncbi:MULTISPECIES: hypothetical protein [Microbacterium]|uniref:Uncharacterized protein n=1 Tax=Microbacterium wangchenii TaxID=2541726 RepID=A0ABX5SXB7_9MICO|nr:MULTISPECIES: hypothetical protein [Microbacterium]MCK6067612.1 hypothetical protein [Microbacterium sp. EYE_512]QBR89464.1 hypothetical protein E4K62_12725 [Microbacterium wangchenii]